MVMPSVKRFSPLGDLITESGVFSAYTKENGSLRLPALTDPFFPCYATDNC